MKGAKDAKFVDNNFVLAAPGRNDIIMKAIHMSCKCDKINDQVDYAGILIYDCGSYEGMNGPRFSASSGNDAYRAGYVILKDASLLPNILPPNKREN